jgi:hypothetical protein
MDRQDDLRALLDGLTCTVCDEPVPPAGIRLLASRDDLVFLQLDCRSCASTTLGFVMTGDGDGSPLEAAGAVDPDAPPVSADDVLDMYQLLAGWTGDLASLVGDGELPDGPPRIGRGERPGPSNPRDSRGAGLAR